MTKTLTLGRGRPLTLSLDERYLSVLESMAHIQGREMADLAREFMEFSIKDALETELEAIGNDSLHGALLLRGWLQTLGKE
jgi:hypothetical protein